MAKITKVEEKEEKKGVDLGKLKDAIVDHKDEIGDAVIAVGNALKKSKSKKSTSTKKTASKKKSAKKSSIDASDAIDLVSKLFK